MIPASIRAAALTALTALTVMLLALVLFPSSSQAASVERGPGRSAEKGPPPFVPGVTRITGYIEDKSGTSIWIKGNRYDIRHAPVKDIRGRPKPPSVLTAGSKVRLHIKDRRVLRVIFIQGYMLQ